MKIIDLTKVKNVFIVCGKTDMRRQIDGLTATIVEEYDMNVYDDAVFLFCGGRKDRFKALYWEGDGFIFLYKRLENGRLKWPRDQQEIKQLTSQQLRWLLEGLSIDQKVTIQPAAEGIVT
ncbi:IS66 family insertion sequence element accessory protein TnpB [Carnobacterium mobile]|uniref:IS66 family insertion sequence element accessory protein TnpB n=1 Tax=Carnobacterium mobile TaxID=2750 RepID=UPI000551F097|nr:IS66 family insertion sequence element accessory protein TnpB [Carnobacterium mobile]